MPAELPVLDRKIGDWFDHGLIRLTMAGVIARSSNIGTGDGRRCEFTPEQLWSYLDLFGLGQRTDVGMPGETRGPAAAGRTWSPLTRAQIAFGQGLSVNALQMAHRCERARQRGRAGLAEPGPGAGHHRGRQRGRHRDHHAAHGRSAQRAATLTAQMMELVTTPDVGTAPGAGIEGYRVAGKTGTAQQVGGTCNCYARQHRGLLRRVRARRQAALHRLRRGPEAAGRRQWRWHRRAGVPQDPEPTSCRSTPWRRPAPSRPPSPPGGVGTPHAPIDSLEMVSRGRT